MKISVKFTIAIEMLILCKQYENNKKMNSRTLAEKIGTSPIVARQIMMNLSSAGLIESKIGPGGTVLKKSLNEITLLEVYKALGEDEGSLLKFPSIPKSVKSDPDSAAFGGYTFATDDGIDIDIDSAKVVPNERFYLEGSLRAAMETDFKKIQASFEDELGKRTVDDYYKAMLPAFAKYGNFSKNKK